MSSQYGGGGGGRTREMLWMSMPLATQQFTPPRAATRAAWILEPMPPRPMVDLCPIAMS